MPVFWIMVAVTVSVGLYVILCHECHVDMNSQSVSEMRNIQCSSQLGIQRECYTSTINQNHF